MAWLAVDKDGTEYIYNQKPRKVFFKLISINKQFLEHPLYTGRTWWWKYESDIFAQQEQRRLFIEHLINKTRPKNFISALEVANTLFFQWFFIRLTKCHARIITQFDLVSVSITKSGIGVCGNSTQANLHSWYSIQYWVLPCTGWRGKFIILNKEPKFIRVTKKRIVNE